MVLYVKLVCYSGDFACNALDVYKRQVYKRILGEWEWKVYCMGCFLEWETFVQSVHYKGQTLGRENRVVKLLEWVLVQDCNNSIFRSGFASLGAGLYVFGHFLYGCSCFLLLFKSQHFLGHKKSNYESYKVKVECGD